jgi:hypothetical protein
MNMRMLAPRTASAQTQNFSFLGGGGGEGLMIWIKLQQSTGTVFVKKKIMALHPLAGQR